MLLEKTASQPHTSCLYDDVRTAHLSLLLSRQQQWAMQTGPFLEPGALRYALEAICTNSAAVACRGQNAGHQCGVPVEGLLLQPHRVSGLPADSIQSLHAGHRQSALMYGDGTVYAWGRNTSGELGLGHWSHTQPSPARTDAFEGHPAVRTLAIGHDHTLFADADGGMWTCGSNEHGQLGLGTPLPSQYAQAEPAQRAQQAQASVPVMIMKRQIDSRVRRPHHVAHPYRPSYLVQTALSNSAGLVLSTAPYQCICCLPKYPLYHTGL